MARTVKLLRRPISASDRIPDRFCVIGMDFLSLSRRRESETRNAKRPSAAMSEEKRLPGYILSNNAVGRRLICLRTLTGYVRLRHVNCHSFKSRMLECLMEVGGLFDRGALI